MQEFVYLFIFSRSKGYIWNEMFFRDALLSIFFRTPYTLHFEKIFLFGLFLRCFVGASSFDVFLFFAFFFISFGDEMLCIKGEGD